MKSWVDFYCGNNNKELKKLVNKILISNFGWVASSEYDDFYSLAAQVIWSCEQNFSNDKNTSFNTYLISCLIRKIKTRITYMNRDKRKQKDIEGNLIADISYDELINDGVTPDTLIIYEDDDTEEYSEKIKYVFIFENRGELVGVSMPHPHGQIYGYSVVPKKLELEIEAAKEYHEENGKCIFCEMIEQEEKFEKRVIFENEHFSVILPFFVEYPYGVYIMSKRHVGNITELTDDEKRSLAETLKLTTGMLDSLFDYKFPYMMCMHNAPVNTEDTSEYYHFHIEFFPPMRSADKQKFNASSETGAWAHCNPTAPEEKAEELREALERFKKTMEG